MPFEIPENWVWTTGNEIFLPLRSCIPQGETFKYVDIDAIDNKVNSINNPKIIRTVDAPSRATRYTKVGDVLFSMVRPYLRNIAIIPENGWIASTGFYVCSPSKLLLSQYCYYLMLSDYVVDGLNQYMKGDNSPSINNGHITSWLYPIPPLTEQQRIVAEIEKWFTLIDSIEQGKSDLQAVIKRAKNKILDLAIHGKLVPQDPNDEPASELLKRINPNAQITTDNGHYENVPSNWTPILLGDLCFTINGLWKGKKPPFVNVGVIRNANFTKDCKLDYTNIVYLDVEEKQYEKRKLQCGDIIVEKSGGSDNQPVGRTILFEKKDGNYSFSNFTAVLRIHDGYPALPEFLNMFLQFIYQTGITKRMQTQTTGIHNLVFDQFLAIPILLPPITEQSRIIDKINTLFQIFDNINAEL